MPVGRKIPAFIFRRWIAAMLVIISDLHLTDGSSGATVAPWAFEIFAQEFRDLATSASFRSDGSYRPIQRIDLLLLGDVLDVIRSSRWALRKTIRPWGDARQPEFNDLVAQITHGILRHNDESLAVLRQLAAPGGVTVPPANSQGRPVGNAVGQPVEVKIHYMVGNHDWFFRLPGASFDILRQSIVQGLGLCNSALEPFAHEPSESSELLDVMRRHKVFARHGDVFDPLNFEGDRNASSLGDAIVIELLNRFLLVVTEELGDDLPESTLLGLRELDNIRPLMLVPVWIDGLLERSCPSLAVRKRVKAIWDRLADEFLEMPFVRQRESLSSDSQIDELARLLKFTTRISLGWASRIVTWLQSLRGQASESYYQHALAEQDFRNRRARHIVYGHTHYAESVPLDASHSDGSLLNQIYFNSGTWRRVLRQTESAPNEHEFIPADSMTYLAFFQGDERKGRPYETWTGTLGLNPTETQIHRIDAGHSIDGRSQQIPTPAIHGLAPHFARFAAQGPIVPRRRV
jgi:UDP-2,3-diacylglucosamine pyrophosphatase LpxH